MRERALVVLSMWIAACGGGGESEAPDGAASPPDAGEIAAPDASAGSGCAVELQALLDQGREESGAPGASAAVIAADCTWSAGSGVIDLPGAVATQADSRFRIGSITKTFTAAVVLQLVEEGTLSLTDVVDTYVAGVVNGDTITIEQLLRHTSGLYNYTDGEFFGGGPREWTPAEIVAYANDRSPVFEPGAEWSYSNTNYVLLGMIIEEATGDAYHVAVRTRLVDPLGLADTFVEGSEAIPGDFARGYVQSGGEYVDIRDDIHPSQAWAAGAMVSTSGDLVEWARALLGGDDVLSAESRQAMLSPTELPDGTTMGYGLGMGVGDSPFGPVAGHGGGIHGFRSDLLYFPDVDAAFAVLVNDSNVDPQDIEIPIVEAVLAP